MLQVYKKQTKKGERRGGEGAKVATDSNESRTSFGRCDHVAACPKAAYC